MTPDAPASRHGDPLMRPTSHVDPRSSTQRSFARTMAAIQPFIHGMRRASKLVLIASVVMRPLAAGAQADSVQPHINRGDVRLKAGDLSGAIAEYTSALKADSTAKNALTKRGLAREDRGDLSGAIADFTKAIKSGHPDSTDYFNRAFALAKQHENKAAIADYTDAINLGPKFAYAYNNRANRYLAIGDTASALDDFTKAIATRPNYALAYRNRALVLAALGREGAIADFTTAVRLDPKNPANYTGRGRTYQKMDKFDEAIGDFTLAIAIQPTSNESYIDRAIAYGAKGDLASARADADTAVAKDVRDPIAYEARSYIRLASHDGDGAASDAKQTLRMRDSADTRLPYGVLVAYFGLRMTGKESDATNLLNEWAPRLAGSWPAPVIACLRGQLSATDLMNRAKDRDSTTEAQTYLALDLVLSGKTQAARPYLEWVRSKGTRTYFEYPVAVAELRRLDEKGRIP